MSVGVIHEGLTDEQFAASQLADPPPPEDKRRAEIAQTMLIYGATDQLDLVCKFRSGNGLDEHYIQEIGQ